LPSTKARKSRSILASLQADSTSYEPWATNIHLWERVFRELSNIGNSYICFSPERPRALRRLFGHFEHLAGHSIDLDLPVRAFVIENNTALLDHFLQARHTVASRPRSSLELEPTPRRPRRIILAGGFLRLALCLPGKKISHDALEHSQPLGRRWRFAQAADSSIGVASSAVQRGVGAPRLCVGRRQQFRGGPAGGGASFEFPGPRWEPPIKRHAHARHDVGLVRLR
jgi:hypothetical protein